MAIVNISWIKLDSARVGLYLIIASNHLPKALVWLVQVWRPWDWHYVKAGTVVTLPPYRMIVTTMSKETMQPA